MNGSLGSQVIRQLRGLAKGAVVLGAGVAVLALLSMTSAQPVQMFFRLLALASTALMLFSIVMMLLTFRRARAIEAVPLLVSLAVSIIGTLITLIPAGALPPMPALVAGFVAGLAMGWGWSLTTLFYMDEGQIRGRGTLWYLAIWALTFALNQIVAIITGHAPPVMSVLMVVGAGLTFGNTCGLLVRLRRASARFAATNTYKETRP